MLFTFATDLRTNWLIVYFAIEDGKKESAK
jgi:hypothetical protein